MTTEANRGCGGGDGGGGGGEAGGWGEVGWCLPQMTNVSNLGPLRFHCHVVGISRQNWVSPEQRRGRGHSIDGLNGVHFPGSTLENEDWIRPYNGSRKNAEKIGFS